MLFDDNIYVHIAFVGNVFRFNGFNRFTWFNMGRITKNDHCLIKTILKQKTLRTNAIWRNSVVTNNNFDVAFSLHATGTADGVTSQVRKDVPWEMGQQLAAARVRCWRHRAGLPSRRTLSSSARPPVVVAIHAVIRPATRPLHRVRMSQ